MTSTASSSSIEMIPDIDTTCIDDSNISRECIQCDACGTKDPRKRCSNCRSVFYCSIDCQKRHWKKQHKRTCLAIEEGIQKMKQDDGFFGGKLHYSHDDVELAIKITTSDTTTTTSCCSICLQEPIVSPVLVKACRHTFCSSCLYKWQMQSTANDPMNFGVMLPLASLPGGPAAGVPQKIYFGQTPTECPTCRGQAGPSQVIHTLVAVSQQALDKAKAAAAASAAVDETAEANNDDDDDDLSHTLQEIDKVLALQMRGHDDDGGMADFALYATKAQILLFLQKPKQALECLSEFDAVRMDPTWKATTPEGLGVLLLECQAFILLKNWNAALDRCTLKSAVSLASSQLRLVHMMQAACLYNLGKYDETIQTIDSMLGGMIFGQNYRHYPGIHKYKALALQAKGNIKGALIVMNQAVLYETPYEEKRRRAVGETAGEETALDLYKKMLTQTKN